MKTIIAGLVTSVVLAIAAPAAAGGYDRLWFDDRYYRAGDVVRAEAGVSTPAPMHTHLQLVRIDGRTMPSAVVRAVVATDVPADREYADPDGGSNLVEYVVEVEFRMPALPPGEYWVEGFCGLPCRAVGPWVGGTFFSIGELPAHGPARPQPAALPS